MRSSITMILVCAFLQASFLCAREEPPSESEKIEVKEIEETIRLLEDPEEAGKLAAQLKSLLEAQRQLGEEKQGERRGKEIVVTLAALQNSFEKRLVPLYHEIRKELKALPLSYGDLKEYLSSDRNYREFLSLLMRVATAVASGLLLFAAVRFAGRRLGSSGDSPGPPCFSEKVRIACGFTLVKTSLWLGLPAAFSIFFLLNPVSGRWPSLFLGELGALAVFFALRNLFYAALTPEKREHRLFGLKEETAYYIFIWARRILLFSLWMVLLIVPCAFLNLPVLKAGFIMLLKAGWIVMAAVILAQWKSGIEKALSLTPLEEDSLWRSRFKSLFNYLIGKLYLFIIAYVGLLVVFFVLGYSYKLGYLVSATFKSLIVLLVAAGIGFLWNFLFRKLFDISKAIKEKYPDLEKQVNLYINVLESFGYFLIALLAFLTVLQFWGVKIYTALAANIAMMNSLVRIVIMIVVAVVIVQLCHFFVRRLEKGAAKRMLKSRHVPEVEVQKRVSTLGGIIRKIILITVVVIVTMMVFTELGFDIKPILASAGVLGLAVAFGAQNLVRDFISGLFLIVENRIRVGDVAVINGQGGLVEQVNLRTSILRSLDGTVHVFRNGDINTLSNMTHEFSYYVFEMGVAYKEDTDRVVEVMKQVGEEVMIDEAYAPFILAPLEILGVDKFADSAVVIKARIKTSPVKQWFVGREMNRRLKKKFDELGIEIPFPHMTFYFGEASKPVSLERRLSEGDQERLKALIREVLKE